MSPRTYKARGTPVGRPPKALSEKQSVAVCVRFTPDQIAEIDRWRGTKPRAAFIVRELFWFEHEPDHEPKPEQKPEEGDTP